MCLKTTVAQFFKFLLTSLIIFTASRILPSFLAHIASLLFTYTNTLVSLPDNKDKKRLVYQFQSLSLLPSLKKNPKPTTHQKPHNLFPNHM